MIDYTQWPRKTAKVYTLLLDPENPRIPPTEEDLSQDELLAELVEHDRVYELAKQIAANGYYTDEMLITAPHDGKLVVVEGNRRLAALKALLSPEAVPEKHVKKFRALSAKVPKAMIKVVPITLAPSRDAALPRIAEKHTRPLLEQWKPAQQARFYRSLVEQGRPVAEICYGYGLTEGKLADFLSLDILYQMACSLDLPEEVQQKVENPRRFHITTVERFMQSQAGREFLGVETDPRLGFKGKVSAREFKKGFAKIVTDVAKGRVTSRIINNIKLTNKYVEGIKEYRPARRRGARFTSKDIVKKPEKSVAVRPAKQKTKRARRSSTKVIPSDLKCGVDSRRINGVFDELRRLKVEEFPNAVSVLLRVLLELSVSDYIQRKGRTKDLVHQCDKKGTARKDWHPGLRQQITFVIDSMDLGLEPLELKALKAFNQDKYSLMSLDTLDGFVHNKQMQPTEPELQSIWIKIEPLMRIVLTEPK